MSLLRIDYHRCLCSSLQRKLEIATATEAYIPFSEVDDLQKLINSKLKH
jgi:hypothetical protein